MPRTYSPCSPDQIGDAVYLGEASAELDVLAQAHAVEIDDLSLPRIDVEAGSGYSADVVERLYLLAKRFGINLERTDATLVAILARLFAVRPRSIRVVAELFGFSVERADVTLVAIWARLFAVRAMRIRPLGKFVHPRKTVLAIVVLMIFVHLLPRVCHTAEDIRSCYSIHMLNIARNKVVPKSISQTHNKRLILHLTPGYDTLCS